MHPLFVTHFPCYTVNIPVNNYPQCRCLESIFLSVTKRHALCMSVDFMKLLTELGLTPTETRVYLSSLKSGPTLFRRSPSGAKLSRTATYDVIAALQERGLMSTFDRGKKKFFTAEEPERAVAYLRLVLLISPNVLIHSVVLSRR